jgi:hypothetical protein
MDWDEDTVNSFESIGIEISKGSMSKMENLQTLVSSGMNFKTYSGNSEDENEMKEAGDEKFF